MHALLPVLTIYLFVKYIIINFTILPYVFYDNRDFIKFLLII